MSIKLAAPTFEHHHDAFGVNESQPRLSWKFVSDRDATIRNWEQTAYELQLDEQIYHVASSDSVLVPWPGESLTSRDVVRVRVRAHGRADEDSEAGTQWSPWTTVEAGLLSRQDWQAVIISTRTSLQANDGSLAPIRFRSVFTPNGKIVKKARLYVTSFGVYEATLNGDRVGDHYMSPGWTSYNHRLYYQVFDVTSMINAEQSNVFGIEVAAGWYASALGWLGGRRYRYGDKLGCLAQLEIYSEVGKQIISTNDTWKFSLSSITSSEIYNGESCDMNLEETTKGWNSRPDYNDGDWTAVTTRNIPTIDLLSNNAPPVRRTSTLSPVQELISPSGKRIIDFGQNMVGKVRVGSINALHGASIVLRHAEVLEDNELGVRPLRTAACTDAIISSEARMLDWTPKYTFHGFRYVEIECRLHGKPIEVDIADITAEVYHTDMVRSGEFECSHALMNKLHENALWSMRGNFLSLPTDCPQRDERLGWTGDIAVFAPSACSLYDITGMLSGWLADLAAEQFEAGRHSVPPLVVPSVIERDKPGDVDQWWPRFPQAIWGDSTILIPWALYQASGDTTILRTQFASMRSWLEAGVRRGHDDLWDEEIWQLGDWLDPNASPHDPGDGRTDGTLVADAYLVHVSGIFAQIASILESDAADSYSIRHDRLRTTFQDKYISRRGLIVGDTQTALALAIRFNLLEPEHKAIASARLARHVKKSRFKIATGFAGTPHICHALVDASHPDLAYRLVLNKDLPSWMYQVSMGATTIWERWDSMLPDGKVNPGEMTSFNHYALGSVVSWMHQCVAGLTTLTPGWKRFQFNPQPIADGPLTSAKLSYTSPYGRIECAWVLEKDGHFKASLLVPMNSEAVVVLPGRLLGEIPQVVGSGYHQFESVLGGAAGVGCEHSWPPKATLPPFWDQTQPEHV